MGETSLTLLWRYQTGSYVHSLPAVANGVVYIDSFDGYLYALNARDGSLIWRSQSYTDAGIAPAVVNGIVYSSGAHAFNALNGSLIWHQQQIYALSEPTVARGVVYIGGNGVYALNAHDGAILWNYLIVNNVYFSPVIAP